MPLCFRIMDEAFARLIVGWSYPPPYDFYNVRPEDCGRALGALADPRNAYYAITEPSGDLVAYCCFGADAQVPGGDYSSPALDIGLGLCPDLTGQGRGTGLVNAVLGFARDTFGACRLRVTVAQFNVRAQRVWEKAGFRPVLAFSRQRDATQFVMMLREP